MKKQTNLSKKKKKNVDTQSNSNEKPEELLLSKMQRILEKIVDKKIDVGKDYYDLLNKMEQNMSDRERIIKEEKDKDKNDKFLSILQARFLSDIISSTYTENGDRVYDEVDKGIMTKKLTELVKKMK